MKSIRRALPLTVLLSLLLAACGALDPAGFVPAPTPMPGAGGTPLPGAQLTFIVTPPDQTPEGAALSIEFVDLVTGVPYHSERQPMNQLEDGRWQIQTQVPKGSLVRYRYLLAEPDSEVESNAFGQPVRYRVAHAPGPIQIEDRVASWGDSTFNGPTGRILGRVRDAGSGAPVGEMIVSAAGQTTFTDGEGRFRLEGLPVGLQNVVAYHPEGRFRVAQQGAILAEDMTTPAEFEVQPAQPVTMTFQVTVPADTPSELPVRMGGSLSSLGALFAEIPGGGELSASRMPEMVHVDGSSYLLLIRMYAGTDLRYKYTLGDGLWNAERAANGGFRTRQLIVSETDTTVKDTVVSWGAEAARELRFRVQPPENTPSGDEVSLQLNPFTWFEPLPMVADNDGTWNYALRGPLDFAGTFEYRYCRNFECGRAGTAESQTGEARDGSLSTGGGQTVEESIDRWAWWGEPSSVQVETSQPITSRPNWQVGVEFVPRHQATWSQFDPRSMDRAASINSNSVTLTPTWVLSSERPIPVIEFDPRYARFESELMQAAAAAEERGLELVLRPELRPTNESMEMWWAGAARDSIWWTVWFEEYRSFLLTQAVLAERAGAARLVISGAQLAPALPDGTLDGGAPSGVPLDAETRWRDLLEEVRRQYSGQLAFEVEAGESLARVPPFLDTVDAVHVYWHRPLSSEPTPEPAQMAEAAGRGLDGTLAALPVDIPIYLSVEYLSIEGSATACPPARDNECRSSSAFDVGAVADEDIAIDLQAQTEVLRAVLLEAVARERIAGFSARRFYPLAALQDKSASVYGKPAADMLSYEYARLLGTP